jgi:c-di-GMP-binding flagellar brake protein YcgR
METQSSLTEIFCPGKSVQIEVVNNYGNKIITKTSVCRMDDLNLILNLPKQTGTFNQVNADVDVIVVCKHNDDPQDYVFATKFIMVKEDDPPLLVLSKPLETNIGRHTVRYSVSLPFSYFINDREIKGGEVKDLSCFGLMASIKPDDSLEIGLGILFKLVLATSPSQLLIMGTIVRLLKQEKEYQVALDYSHIADDLQDQISQFLFSLQNSGVKKEQQQRAAFIKIN